MKLSFEPEGFQPPKAGLYMLYGCVVFLFLLFVLRFWYLQVLRGEDYARQSVENRLRMERVYSPRGLILDRHGRLLAENRPSYCLALIREDCPDIPNTLAQVSQWTDIPLDLLTTKFLQDRNKVKSFEPYLLATDIPFDTLIQIEMKLPQWPGLSIIPRQRRYYPEKLLFSHILGYVAEANEKEMDADKELALGDIVGKLGLEFEMEKRLRGRKGMQQIEVDASGRQLARIVKAQPRGGENITLSLDADLQLAAAKALGEEAGSIVVMEPDTGKIRALLTQPAYDNNAFTTRLSTRDWLALRDDPRHPLLNRSVQSVYPPGSIWKLMMAGLVLSEGIKPSEQVHCSGAVQLGSHTFRCWKAGGHGRMDLANALVNSCDVYFYHMGDRIGIDKLAAYAKASGFGNLTGISLPGENKGLVPDKIWRQSRSESWQKGDTLNVAIGQGSTLVTPLQMAAFVGALLNDGKILQPSLMANEAPVQRGHLPMTPESRKLIVDAMRRTVDTGTAKRLFRQDVVIGGKTGTAQVVRLGETRIKTEQMPYKHRDHAWMASWGVKGGRQYVVIVMVEHGGGGSAAAGPVAREVFSALFGPPPGAPLERAKNSPPPADPSSADRRATAQTPAPSPAGGQG